MTESISKNIEKFNVRVYGILKHKDLFLISEELILDKWITKFPGGGVELGEGIQDALKREFVEELNVEVKVGELFYVNDFFQHSFYKPTQQLVCVYYFVELVNPKDILKLYVAKDSFYDSEYQLHWRTAKELQNEMFNFPIDQKEGRKLSGVID